MANETELQYRLQAMKTCLDREWANLLHGTIIPILIGTKTNLRKEKAAEDIQKAILPCKTEQEAIAAVKAIYPIP